MKDQQKSRRIIMWNKVKELSEIGLNKSQIAMELSIGITNLVGTQG